MGAVINNHRTLGKKTLQWEDTLGGKAVLGLILPAVFVFVWYLGLVSHPSVVPSPWAVLDVFAHPFKAPADLNSGSLAFSIFITMIRMTLGFGLGLATAVPLGLMAGRNKVIARILNPTIQIARPINPIVLLPLATVFIGMTSFASVFVGEAEAWRHDIFDQIQIAMIFILWWGAFFPIFISTVHGVKNVREVYIETLRMMGADSGTIFRKVICPHALPSIVNGMRIAMGVTWLVIIAAEIYPGTRSGLGYMLCTACKTSDYQYTFAAVIVIGFIGLLTDTFFDRLERRVSRWRPLER